MLAAEINLPTPFPFPPFMSRTLKPPSRVNIPGIDHAFRSNADYPLFDGKNSTIMALRLAEGNFAHHFCTWNFEFVSTLALPGVKWLEYDTQRRIWHSGKLVANFRLAHTALVERRQKASS